MSDDVEVISKLREALKFYADEKNYQRSGDPQDSYPELPMVNSDRGKIARKALKPKR
jgi:hypothetical protein